MKEDVNQIDSDNLQNLDKFLGDIEALESLVKQWDSQQQDTCQALMIAQNALQKEAFTRLIRLLKKEPVALNILKAATSDEVIYSVLRGHAVLKASLQERIEDALESVRPYLQSHGGNVELVSITVPDTVEVRLLGACDGCPSSFLTLTAGVEKAIKEYCPEITTVKKAKSSLTTKPADNSIEVHIVSPFDPDNNDWIAICPLEEVPVGDIKLHTINGNDVILSRFDNSVKCYQNACAHMGMPLDMGEVKNNIIICPHHAFEYSLESGECLTVPEVQLHTHAVRVIDNHVEVKLL